jgi:hypothetical protein
VNSLTNQESKIKMKMNYINTRQLTRDGNKWSAEISDLGPDFQFKPVGRYGSEAGIVVFSHVTGANISFVQTQLLTEGNPLDSEITGWVLKPCAIDAARFPATKDLIITLFND